jgi:diguanylate cyclase (GGDEF)-like protein
VSEAKQQLAQTVADSIAMALANLLLRESLREQSIRDPLTGLFNRRYMEESLEREISRAERNNSTVGLIMIDVDHLKRVNDAFGHAAGDTLLRELGRVLRVHIRESDIACRYGGEEFTLILPEASREVARERAELLRQEVKRLRFNFEAVDFPRMSVSLGVAVYPDHGLTGEALLRAGDAALYRAKHQGRDRVELV